jgi:hypothetical protein
MKPTVILSAFNVANYPEGGGHFWVYMQYLLGLRRSGCDVYWLERFVRGSDPRRDATAISTFFERMNAFGLGGRAILLADRPSPDPGSAGWETLGMTERAAEGLFRGTDLLLNFHYAIEPELLGRFRRTALVDIDPGLLQFWISRGQLVVPRHDHYFTTGETVGEPGAVIPDCGVPWVRIRPPVYLEQWPYHFDPAPAPMTTISGWDSKDWIADGEIQYANTKRVSFLKFRELPGRTHQPLELALYMRTASDAEDRNTMERHGWRIRSSGEVAGSPDDYRAYIQGSRGEFSCAKPSCMRFRNAWVSDRTLCYLASGKPVVVQHTGPSGYLPDGEGMFRFTNLDEAARALEAVNADYERHCRAAREIAETYFDARKVTARILDSSIGWIPRPGQNGNVVSRPTRTNGRV